MTDPTTALLTTLHDDQPVDLPLARLGARGLLEALANDGGSYWVRFDSALADVEVEIGNGMVMGARARRDEDVVEGREAYVLLRRIRRGRARVEPRRFLSLANVLEPIGSLPHLGGGSSAPPPRSLPSVEIELPVELATVPATREIVLPERRVAPPVCPQARVEPSKSPKRGRTWLAAGGAALALVGLAAVALARRPANGESQTPIPVVAASPQRVDVPAPAAEEEQTDAAATASPDAPNPRALARTARRLLRSGHARAALRRARAAARLRRGLPYYQVLLGDALAANGRDVAAHRAWRRALRLQPGYAPAERRLGDAS